MIAGGAENVGRRCGAPGRQRLRVERVSRAADGDGHCTRAGHEDEFLAGHDTSP